MNLLSRILSSFLLLVSAVPVFAQDGYFVVTRTSGEDIRFKVAEKPSLNHSDGHLVVTTSSLEAEFEFAEIARAWFSELTGIETAVPEVSEGSVTFDFVSSPGAVLISGAQWARAYSLDGILVSTATGDAGQTLTLDVAALRLGVYIISTDVRNIKFSKP